MYVCVCVCVCMYVYVYMYICEHMYSINACVCCVKWMGEWMDRCMHTFSIIHLFRMKLTNQVNIQKNLSTLNQYPKLLCVCMQARSG